jgi:hypothetical protein
MLPTGHDPGSEELRTSDDERDVIVSYHRLTVVVKDANGNQLQEAYVRLRSWSPDHNDALAALARGVPLPDNIASSIDHQANIEELRDQFVLPDTWWWVTARTKDMRGGALVYADSALDATVATVVVKKPDLSAHLGIEVVDSDARPVSRFQVALTPLLPAMSHGAKEIAREGNRKMIAAAPGVYKLIVEADGYYFPFVKHVSLSQGMEALQAVRLSRGGRLRFWLRMADGHGEHPFHGLRVIVRDASGNNEMELSTFVAADNGGWRPVEPMLDHSFSHIDLLREGNKVVRVSAEGYRDWVVSCFVEAGATTDVPVFLAR